tara:strand:+ start:373 stop:579 length:207 start_codon:yes stop_codon:yes gene_type:complete
MHRKIITGDLVLNQTTKDIGLVIQIQRDGHQYERYEMYDLMLGGIKQQISEYQFYAEEWKLIDEKNDS